jgi:hypothetical protein
MDGIMNKKNIINRIKRLLSNQKVIGYKNIFETLEDLKRLHSFYNYTRPASWPVIDENIFEAVGLGNSFCNFMPMSTMPYFFRGQIKDYNSCIPAIYRTSNNNDIDIFINRLRSIEFEMILKKHPAVIDLNKTKVYDCYTKVDFTGLAQHYGLLTDCLDITDNFYIAAFFACCEYNKDMDKYIPKTEPMEGIIYLISSLITEDYDNFNIVGLQPFHRPAEQRAFSYKLNKGDDLAKKPFVQKLKFKQTPEGTKYLYQMFNNGNKLFPYDMLKNKVEEIKATNIFSKKAFLETYKRYIFTKHKDYYLNKLRERNIILEKNTILQFNSEEIKNLNKLWKKKKKHFFNDTGGRRAIYP